MRLALDSCFRVHLFLFARMRSRYAAFLRQVPFFLIFTIVIFAAFPLNVTQLLLALCPNQTSGVALLCGGPLLPGA